jgi:cephalosporin-C deacetylase
MPVLDMPWDELQRYQGRNPRPDDFDAYWTKALGELEAQPAELQIDELDLGFRSARCADLWFTGVGGARVYGKFVRPTVPDGRGRALAIFHGYTGRSPDWFELMGYAAEGYTVLALDCRGQGGRSMDTGGPHRHTHLGHIVRGLLEGPEALLYRSIFTDLVRTAQVLMDAPGVDPTKVAVHGGSQGGGLSLACAALEPRVRAVAAVFPFLCDYQRVWEMDLAKDAYEELREWLRLFDPRHERIDETFLTLGYIDVQHLADRIRGDVLLATGLGDAICPPSTQFAAYNRITSRKEVVVYPDFGHENLPDLTDRVFRFLDERM